MDTSDNILPLASEGSLLRPPPLPARPHPSRKRGFLRRYFSGELPLGQTLWLGLVCAPVAWAGLFLVSGWLAARIGLVAQAWTWLTLFWITHALLAGLVLGAINSLRRSHAQREPKWKVLLFATLIMCWLGTVVMVDVYRLLPARLEMQEIAAGDIRMGKMRLRVSTDGRILDLEGGLQAGSGEEFVRFLSGVPRVRVVRINSPGGRFREALIMADSVTKRGLSTHVSRLCGSAATLIFLAGRERTMDPWAKIGFHSTRSALPEERLVERNNDLAVKRMKAAGVSEAFAVRAMSTPSTDVWYPSEDELLKAGVLTKPTW